MSTAHSLDRRRPRPTNPSLIDRYTLNLGVIVERRAAEATLRYAKERAETAALVARHGMEEAQAASRAKTEFLAMLSHEFRTPLNAIIGFSEIMAYQLRSADTSQKYLDYSRDIHQAGTHLLKLISDLLDLVRVEFNKLTLEEDEVDVNEVIAASLVFVRETARKNDLTLIFHPVERLPGLYADERRVKQVLIILLSNAIKFTPMGGEISVAAGRSADGGVHVSVSDTGIGMRPEDIPRAMEPFVQIDTGLARKYEGTGLGLPLATKLIDMHGGRLRLESEFGAGTTATIEFPPDRSRPRATA